MMLQQWLALTFQIILEMSKMSDLKHFKDSVKGYFSP
jgi:hypothetical protein